MSNLTTIGTAAYSDAYRELQSIRSEKPPLVYRASSIEYIEWSFDVASPSDSDTSSFRPRTELGRRLWELRIKGMAAGERLMGKEEIEQEIRERRGERDNKGI
jgi:hypothetical protein